MKYKGRSFMVKVYVFRHVSKPLLSRNVINMLNVIA